MNMRLSIGWSLVVFALLAAPRAGLAQTDLVWKLKPGQQFDLHVEQQSASTVTVVNKTTKTTIEMTLGSTWVVEGVEDGTAKIHQQVRRAQIKVQAADAPLVSYDTANPGQPSGAQKDLADAVGPLVDPESSILLTMNPRGEILAVELSPKLAQLWDAAKPADKSGGAAQHSLDAVLKQPLAILPEKAVSSGDKWQTTRELITPAGKFSQKIEYSYDGRSENAAQAADAISYSATLTPAAPGKTKIKEQSQTGKVLFDAAAGGFVSSEQKQRLVTETPYRDATIRVIVEGQMSRTLTPR